MAEADHNFVADMQNWSDRVEVELKASATWEHNWGPLFNPDAPKNYGGKIEALQSELAQMTGKPLTTESMAYGVGKPFAEIAVGKATNIQKELNKLDNAAALALLDNTTTEKQGRAK